MQLLGCDFSSRPSRRKPILLAYGICVGDRLHLQRLDRLESLEDYGRWAAVPGAWVGGFDFPFGLSRELVTALGWPAEWEACMRHYAGLSRQDIRSRFIAFCQARPVGGKFAHRATERLAGASPSMKWVQPPVAYMMHAGVLPLLDGGVHLPGLQPPPPPRAGPDAHPAGMLRVALEAYPGMLAREVLGHASYKSDDTARQTEARTAQRVRLLQALEQGATRLGIALDAPPALRLQLLDDGSGDSLDAVLCLVQAAWAWRQGPPRYGLPEDLDPLEGWIVGAPVPGESRQILPADAAS